MNDKITLNNGLCATNRNFLITQPFPLSNQIRLSFLLTSLFLQNKQSLIIIGIATRYVKNKCIKSNIDLCNTKRSIIKYGPSRENVISRISTETSLTDEFTKFAKQKIQKLSTFCREDVSNNVKFCLLLYINFIIKIYSVPSVSLNYYFFTRLKYLFSRH